MDMEHGTINSYLKELKKGLEKKEDVKKIFYKLKWIIEKHFFLEEKAIFLMYQNIKGEQIAHIFELMQEHGVILELLKNIENAIKNKVEHINLSYLEETLDTHQLKEDKYFYPELENDLTENQRKEIIARAEDIMRA
jgi:iron-sulfur cluster repair protein YtfE (RIC family)